MNEILVIVLLVFLVGKWGYFILMLFPIRLLKQKERRRIETIIVNEKCRKPITLKNDLKSLIGRYGLGYIRYMDFQVGFIPSHSIRNFIYKHVFMVQLEDKAVIYWGCEIRSHAKLHIGEGSIIGDKALLDARNYIYIGKNVNFSSNVSIYTEQHDHRDPLFRCNSNASFQVRIDDRVWIGPNVIILHSVHIGEGAVVAAGSVVTKDILPYTINAGVPAKEIGKRNMDLQYVFDGKYIPFY